METQAGSSGDISSHSSIRAKNAGVSNVPQLTQCQIQSLIMNFPTNVNSAENSKQIQQVSTGVCNTEPRGIEKAKETLKSNLKRKFEVIVEGIVKRGNPVFLRDNYTELYITEGESGGLNKEHEIWQTDKAHNQRSQRDIRITCNDLFKPLTVHDLKKNQENITHGEPEEPDQADKRPPRTVVTQGIAGIGKTVSVQKFILDWAEGKANQDIDLLLVLPFRELNRIKEKELSLHSLLLNFYSELLDVKFYNNSKILFIFDGLDESKLPFDFGQGPVSDVSKPASLDELMTNLITGNLLPSALIWITSRPAAIDKIPPHLVHRMTEVRGFTDSQKEEYFRKKISNQSLASRIISHVKDSRTLEIMCHIPVFCWITAMVLEQMLKGRDEKIPSSLTELYTRFLLIQTSEKKKKYHGTKETDPRNLSEEDVQLILKLGKLAFDNLQKRNIVFSEDDLQEYDIDVTEASLRSGMFTEILKQEDPMFSEKMYSFVHLSFQEYLAALYILHTFALNEEDITVHFWCSEDLYYFECYRDAHGYSPEKVPQREMTLYDLHERVIDKALESRGGHLDLFLRFLLGLSLESNQKLLRSFLMNVENLQKSISQSVQYLKNKLRQDGSETPHMEGCINLFYCLLELNDHSVAEEIRQFLTSDRQAEQKLTAAQCSTLAYIILMSGEVLEELDLKKYIVSKKGCHRLVPAVRNCRKALMADCGLNEACCEIVASALQSSNTYLRELDLSQNFLGSRSLKTLLAALNNPNCRLESLNLSHINLEKTGVDLIGAILRGPHIQPHTLKVCGCSLGDDCAEILASAFSSSECRLKELDISYNNMTVQGVKRVLQGLQSPNCDLKILQLSGMTISAECCMSLALVLTHSVLRELTLDSTSIGDVGVKHLFPGLMSPYCQLQTLRLRDCNLSKEACFYLTVALSTYSVLRELNLGDNDLQDSGANLLSTVLKNPNCILQNLGLSGCMITEEGCSSLASALNSNPSHLRELDLSYNHPEASGEQLLCVKREDPDCKLETIHFDHGGPSRLTYSHWKYHQEIAFYIFCYRTWEKFSADGKEVLRPPEAPDYYWETESSWDSFREDMMYDESIGLDLWDFLDWFQNGLLYWKSARCNEQLTGGRFYWEVEWTGLVSVGIANVNFRSTLRLILNQNSYYALHLEHHLPKTFSEVSVPKPEPRRIGVLLDCPGGRLSFYSVSSLGSNRLYTFHTTFNEPVYPEFYLAPPDEKYGVASVKITAQSF